METRALSEAVIISRCEFPDLYDMEAINNQAPDLTPSSGSPSPLTIYQEIFSWLHPKFNPDVDHRSYEVILARLFPVCRHFAYFAGHESWRRLEFIGIKDNPRPSSWVACTTQRLEIARGLRTEVKEFIVQDWEGIIPRLAAMGESPERFLDPFPRLLSTLPNLETITLSNTPISYSLLQAIGRLRRLDRMVIFECFIGTMSTHYPVQPMFGSRETPFPALRELIIGDSRHMNLIPSFQDIFCALVGTNTLRVLAIPGCYWTQFLLPHVSNQLVSFSGNFSTIFFHEFLEFIRKHPLLWDLTICSNTSSYFLDHWNISKSLTARNKRFLAVGDLPNLGSFSGPFSLAPLVLRGRPVTKLALGCHLTTNDSVIPLTSLHGLTVFPHTYKAVYSWDELYSDNRSCWDCLEDIGGGVKELFVRFDLATLPTRLIPLRFPNLVHLQLEPWSWTMVSYSSYTCTLHGLKRLASVVSIPMKLAVYVTYRSLRTLSKIYTL